MNQKSVITPYSLEWIRPRHAPSGKNINDRKGKWAPLEAQWGQIYSIGIFYAYTHWNHFCVEYWFRWILIWILDHVEGPWMCCLRPVLGQWCLKTTRPSSNVKNSILNSFILSILLAFKNFEIAHKHESIYQLV